MSAADIELAPAAVVRVAGFPLAAVTALSDPAVAALPRSAAQHATHDAAYAASIARQRAALWAVTAADPAFMRALTLCNPTLAAAVPKQLPECRNKRARHLETSLYRYLARAVARTEPNGLWSGVTLAHFGAENLMRAAPAEFHVTPDLAPFQQLFRALAERPAYHAAAQWKLNPTLTPGVDGWRFSAQSRGTLSPRRLRSGPGLDAAIAALAQLGRFTTAAGAAALVGCAHLREADALAAIEQLIVGGVVVGGLAFPRRFTDPWQALALAADRLVAADRPAWSLAVERMRAVADRLTQDLALEPCPEAQDNDTASAERGDGRAIAAAQEQAREVLMALAKALTVASLDPPRAPLRCDLRSPFELRFGPERRAALTELTSDFAAFQAREGMGGVLGPALIRRWLTRPEVALASFVPPPSLAASDASPCWEEVAAALEPAGPLAARVASWSQRLDGDAEIWGGRGTSGELGSPLGCLLFTFGSGVVGGHPVLRGIVRDATPAFARCAWILEPGPTRTLTTWLSGQFLTVGNDAAIDQAELLVGGDSPNVLARPGLLAHAIDVWGTEPGSLDARGAVMVIDGVSGSPLLRLPDRERPLAVFGLTAAMVPAGDYAQQLLLLSSMRSPPQIPRGDRIAFRHELSGRRHSPRLRLYSGAVVRTRRSTLAGAELQALTGSRGAERFARWQRAATARGWPALLSVRRDNDPPLLVPRDSPLAIEALFEGAAGCRHLYVEEFIDAAWITDSSGRQFVGELALPFVRRTHQWSARAVAADQRHTVGA